MAIAVALISVEPRVAQGVAGGASAELPTVARVPRSAVDAERSDGPGGPG